MYDIHKKIRFLTPLPPVHKRPHEPGSPSTFWTSTCGRHEYRRRLVINIGEGKRLGENIFSDILNFFYPQKFLTTFFSHRPTFSKFLPFFQNLLPYYFYFFVSFFFYVYKIPLWLLGWGKKGGLPHHNYWGHVPGLPPRVYAYGSGSQTFLVADPFCC